MHRHELGGLSLSQHKLLLPFLPTHEREKKLETLYNYHSSRYEEEETLFYLALRLNISFPDSYFTIVLKWFSWFTTVRLFFIRVGRVHNVFQHIYSFSCYGYTTILQFSYALELIPCIAQLFNNPDMAGDNEWQSTFTNALVWLMVNICSVATGYAWINLIGFAFDIWHDWYYTNNEIKALQTLLEKLPVADDEDPTAKNIRAKIEELQYKQWRVTIVAIGIFIGMAIFYLNPIAPGWVPILGAFLVILCGGIIGNLGNRLFQWDKLLINICSDSPWKKIWDDELEAILNSIGKLFKELIKPLFPTLWDSLANNLENTPHIALLCNISAFLPSLILAYTCCQFSAVFCVISAHVLLTLAVVLVASELCVRLCTYLIAFAQPKKSASAEEIDEIMRKLEQNVEGDTVGNPQKYFQAFHGLTQQEREILADLAELNVTELLHHIDCWDKNPGYKEPSSNSEASSPRLSTCRYSFLSFKERINTEKSSSSHPNPRQAPIPYPYTSSSPKPPTSRNKLFIQVNILSDIKEDNVPATPSSKLITPLSSETVPPTPVLEQGVQRAFSERKMPNNNQNSSTIPRSSSAPFHQEKSSDKQNFAVTPFWRRIISFTNSGGSSCNLPVSEVPLTRNGYTGT